VVNCAAQAAPAACEGEGEAAARAVNIPHRLLDALEAHSKQHGSEPVLVHISTDHVYDGGRSFYEEAAQLAPVNAYGRHVQPPHPSMSSAWFQAVGLPHDSCAVLGVPLPCAGRHAASGGRAGGSAGPLSEHGCWGLPSRLHPTRQGRCFPS
jgi:hypothetical protein